MLKQSSPSVVLASSQVRGGCKTARGGDSRSSATGGDSRNEQVVLIANREELDFEVQLGVRRDDPPDAACAVTQARRDDELTLAADFHSFDALVPALYHLASTELEDERLVAISGAIKLGTIR